MANVLASFLPGGSGGAQYIRFGLGQAGWMLGWSSARVYYDSDVPSEISGGSLALDAVSFMPGAGSIKTVLDMVSTLAAAESVLSGLGGSQIDEYVNTFLSSISTGILKGVSGPDEAVTRSRLFAGGAAAYFEQNLSDHGIGFERWQRELVNVLNGDPAPLYEQVMNDIQNGEF